MVISADVAQNKVARGYSVSNKKNSNFILWLVRAILLVVVFFFKNGLIKFVISIEKR